MSVWSKIRGTYETLFQLGKGGPNIKNNAGIIEARNAADGAYAVVRGDTPAAGNDLSTKDYVDTSALGGAKREVRYALALINASSATTIPNNAVVRRVTLSVEVAYTAGTTIAIGFAGTPAALMGTGDNNAEAIGIYTMLLDYVWTPAAVILATVAGAPVVGSGFVIVEYSQPVL